MTIKDVYKKISNIRKRNIIINVVLFLIFTGFIWITGTTQGAVRRHLLISDGIKTAVVAEIKMNKRDEIHDGKEVIYSVIIDGAQEQWQFWMGKYTCFGKPKTESATHD